MASNYKKSNTFGYKDIKKYERQPSSTSYKLKSKNDKQKVNLLTFDQNTNNYIIFQMKQNIINRIKINNFEIRKID